MMWFMLHGTLLVTLALMVWRKERSALRVAFWPAWLFKILTTFSVVLIHTHLYPESDIFFFYQWSIKLSEQALTDFPAFISFLFKAEEGYYAGEARSEFFAKLLSIVAVLTHQDMWLMSLWLSMLSFYAAWNLTVVIARWRPAWKWRAAVAFLFLPSAVFWTSGLLKETVAMAAVFFIISVFVRLWSGKRLSLWDYFLLLPLIWIAWKLKYYYVAVLLPVMLAALLTRFVRERIHVNLFSEVLFLKVVFLLLILISGLFHPNLRPAKLIRIVAENHNQMILNTESNHLTNAEIIEPSLKSLLLHIVPGIINGLFAPWQPDFTHAFYMLSVLENWLLILITLLAAAGMAVPAGADERLLLWATLIYCVLLALWLGIAVPAAGTLVRYKAGFVSCWVLLMMPGAMRTLQRLRILKPMI